MGCNLSYIRDELPGFQSPACCSDYAMASIWVSWMLPPRGWGFREGTWVGGASLLQLVAGYSGPWKQARDGCCFRTITRFQS